MKNTKKRIISLILLITMLCASSSMSFAASREKYPYPPISEMDYIGSGYTNEGIYYEVFGIPDTQPSESEDGIAPCIVVTKHYSHFAISFSGIVTPPESIYYTDYSATEFYNPPHGWLYFDGEYEKNMIRNFTVGYYEGDLIGNM